MRICPDCASEYQGAEQLCRADGARLVATDGDPLLGRQIGSYKLVRMLGHGGMGQVYLGLHPGIGSRVAVKLLDDAAARRPDLVERFFAEATAVNRIRHENIVNILDLDRLDGARPYIIMEFLEGRPLSSVIAHFGRLPLGTVVGLSREILSALDAAHRAGIVHRDLKPDNIFVSPQGRAKVLDFGIAKLLPESGGPASFTHTGMVLGTPSYMSPEQVMGAHITPATDIYALGTILYECATGRVPFEGSSLFELLHHQVHTPPPPPRQLRPDLVPELEALILRALAKDPAARFTSAAEMMLALGPASASLPPEAWASISLAGAEPALVAQPTTPLPTPQLPTAISPPQPAPAPRQSRTRRNQWIALAIVGALLTSGVCALALYASQELESVARPEPTPAPEPEPAPTPAPAPAPTRAPALTPARAPALTPAPKPKAKSEPGVKRIGAVTIINTAEKARAETGLQPIERAVANTARFDAVKYLPRAEKLARALMPDAVLTHWEVDGVAPSGLANLDIGGHEATYRFRSPSRSSRPANVPNGVAVDIPCMVYVDVARGAARAYPTTDEACKDKRRPRPRCSLAQVWQRAYARGAPRGNWVASIDYLWDGWFFDITNGKGDGLDFSESIPDDC